MSKALNYGKIRWSFEEEFDPHLPCRPSPFLTFQPVRINGKFITPKLSDKHGLSLLKMKGGERISFIEAYKDWYLHHQWHDRDLSEGRAFLRYLKTHHKSVRLAQADFTLHPYFTQSSAPKHDPHDELAKEHAFVISPVEVNKRKVKLYVSDEDMLNLISLPFGTDVDFLRLVKSYITLRHEWEKWKAPSPSFLEWVKSQVVRPVFSKGQLGIDY